MEIVSIGDKTSPFNLERAIDNSNAVLVLHGSLESKNVSDILGVCNRILEFCTEGTWDVTILARGTFNRLVQDHLLAKVLKVESSSLGEWDDVFLHVSIPEDEIFLAAVCFICLSADWEVVGRAHDSSRAFSIDMDQQILGIECSL